MLGSEKMWRTHSLDLQRVSDGDRPNQIAPVQGDAFGKRGPKMYQVLWEPREQRDKADASFPICLSIQSHFSQDPALPPSP